MKSVMGAQFATTPTISAPRSSFQRDFGYKTTFDAGNLIPFMCDDVLPGDTFNCRTTGFARLSTPEFPFMDNMYMDTQFFFVPYRLVWDNARKFFGEQVNPGDSIDFQLPQMTAHTPAEGSISDYFGLPIGHDVEHHSLYHRAANLIWNEWYRDQNLQDSLVVDTDDGPDTITDYTLQKRGKRRDYFTSALPWPQKGDAVSLPIGSTAPIINNNIASTGALIRNDAGTLTTLSTNGLTTGQGQGSGVLTDDSGTTGKLHLDPNGTLLADLTNATANTINDLREAFQVQKLLEKDARGGTRYSELVKNHFGVSFYDVSYRPEFLGGGSTPIKSTPVATTAQNFTATENVGDLRAFSTAAFNNHGFTKSFVEHGMVLGFVSVRADLTYQQGLERKWSKKTRYDVYWPSLAHLGEQEILNKEIYHQNTAADDEVFGYIPRYDEYRYKPSLITGQFRSTAAAPLDAWHLSQEFSALPTLGPTFIEENPPVDRIVAVPTEPHFIFDSYTQLRCARPMPVNGVPGMIDHF